MQIQQLWGSPIITQCTGTPTRRVPVLGLECGDLFLLGNTQMDSINQLLFEGAKEYEGKKVRVVTIYATAFIGVAHFVNDCWVKVTKDEDNSALINLNNVVSISETK